MAQIDIIVPAHNSSRNIEQAVRSALAQRGVDAHVFVVDDGSTDGTLDQVPPSPRLTKLARLGNGGLAGARNAGVSAGRSPFIAFLDADDRWLEGKLAGQLALLEAPENRAAAFCCSDYLEFEDGSERILRAGHAHGRRPARGQALAHLLDDAVDVRTSTVVLRRVALPSDRPFDEALPFCSGRDLYFRLAERHDLVFDPRVTTAVRSRAASRARDAVGLTRGEIAVYERALERLSSGDLRGRIVEKLGTLYLELGRLESSRDLGRAVEAYRAALQYGGGVAALQGLAAAPIRRIVSPAA